MKRILNPLAVAKKTLFIQAQNQEQALFCFVLGLSAEVTEVLQRT